MVFRHSETDFLLTAARPNLGWFEDLARGGCGSTIEDVSDDYGILAVQGPRSRAVLASLAAGGPTALPYFGHAQAKIGVVPGHAVAHRLHRRPRLRGHGRRRTGALDVLDAILEAGRAHGIRPFGEEALMMLRIEAGLPLVDVEWHNSRLAFTDARAGHPDRARHGLDAARRPGGRPRLRGPRRDPARARREVRPGGRRSASSSTGRTGTGCTATPACCRPRTSSRCPTSRCCTTGDDRRRHPGRLRHELHVLPRAAAAHRPGSGPS